MTDRLLWETFQNYRFPFLDVLAEALCAVTSGRAMFGWSLPAAAWIWRTFSRRAAAAYFVGSTLGLMLIPFLKDLFARQRPPLLTPLPDSFAFPSGHALATALGSGLLAFFLSRRWPERRVVFYAGAALLTVAVGLARVYLGVHWPSDVVAGWLFGAGWVLLWTRLVRKTL